jgi:hypothetical protein
MATANIRATRDTDSKRGKPTKQERNYIVEIAKIKDDGENLMRVAKSRTVGKSLPFARFKISDTTTVELCCNQDPKTAAIANKACRQLVKKFLRADMIESGEILEAAGKAFLEEDGDY